MLSKRGMTEIMMNAVYELLIGAMLGAGFFLFVNQTVNHVTLDKEFLSRDVGVLTQMMEYSPYPFYLRFSPEGVNLSRYKFNWTDSTFNVAYYQRKDIPKIHMFLRNTIVFPNDEFFEKSKNMYLVNDLNKFTIEKTRPNIKLGIPCEKISNKYNNVFLDPAHGEEKDLGFNMHINFKDYNESKIMCNLANAVTPINKNLFSSRDLDVDTINCQGIRRKDSMILPDIEKSDLYIGFTVGNYSTRRNIIKAYVEYNDNYSDARNIACHILNSISEKLDVDTIIIPVDSSDDLFVKKNGASIMLQFGTFNSRRTRNMLDNNITFIASQIRGVING